MSSITEAEREILKTALEKLDAAGTEDPEASAYASYWAISGLFRREFSIAIEPGGHHENLILEGAPTRLCRLSIIRPYYLRDEAVSGILIATVEELLLSAALRACLVKALALPVEREEREEDSGTMTFTPREVYHSATVSAPLPLPSEISTHGVDASDPVDPESMAAALERGADLSEIGTQDLSPPYTETGFVAIAGERIRVGEIVCVDLSMPGVVFRATSTSAHPIGIAQNDAEINGEVRIAHSPTLPAYSFSSDPMRSSPTSDTCNTENCPHVTSAGHRYCADHTCASVLCREETYELNGRREMFCAGHICGGPECHNEKLSSGPSHDDPEIWEQNDLCQFCTDAILRAREWVRRAVAQCCVDRCISSQSEGSLFCRHHKCGVDGCKSKIEDGWIYCQAHHCTVRGCIDPWLSVDDVPFCPTHRTERDRFFNQSDGFKKCVSGQCTNKRRTGSALCEAHYREIIEHRKAERRS